MSTVTALYFSQLVVFPTCITSSVKNEYLCHAQTQIFACGTDGLQLNVVLIGFTTQCIHFLPVLHALYNLTFHGVMLKLLFFALFIREQNAN